MEHGVFNCLEKTNEVHWCTMVRVWCIFIRHDHYMGCKRLGQAAELGSGSLEILGSVFVSAPKWLAQYFAVTVFCHILSTVVTKVQQAIILCKTTSSHMNLYDKPCLLQTMFITNHVYCTCIIDYSLYTEYNTNKSRLDSSMNAINIALSSRKTKHGQSKTKGTMKNLTCRIKIT